jgi:hypothetical protein
MVPWLEIARDLLKPDVRFRLVGSGQAGKPSSLRVVVTNGWSTPIAVTGVRLRIGTTWLELSAAGTVAPKAQEEISVEVEDWPSRSALLQSSAEATVKLSSGGTWSYQAEVELESKSLYERDFTLEGLE